MDWQSIIMGVTGALALANLVVGLLVAKNTAETKAWAEARFVAKTDFMNMLTLLGLPQRPGKGGE